MINHIGYADDSLKNKAELLAAQLGFNLDKDASSCLFLDDEKLSLKVPGFSLMAADFNPLQWAKRKAEGKKQGLVRACKPAHGIKIIDATAGWGRDAAILASLGAEVTMIEQSPIMTALLRDALNRAEVLSLSLVHSDAYDYLQTLQARDYPDVIYIDPMHPQRSKSALVKKEMQVLQQLLGAQETILPVLKLATARVKQRVVVKWPQKSQALLPCDFAIEGKTIRFDVYQSKL